MDEYRKKIKTLSEIKTTIDQLKANRKRIVFTNGCFDLLHTGHTRYLTAAKALGDYLVVAVNSDRSVKAIKGATRPILPQEQRAEMLAGLGFVDGIVIFDEDNPLKLIENLMPHVLVKGGDWQEDEIIGADVVKAATGEVKRIPFVKGYSTTDMIRKIEQG